MKYSWKGHKDRSRHKDRIKRNGQARLVYVFDNEVLRECRCGPAARETAQSLWSRCLVCVPRETVQSLWSSRLVCVPSLRYPGTPQSVPVDQIVRFLSCIIYSGLNINVLWKDDLQQARRIDWGHGQTRSIPMAAVAWVAGEVELVRAWPSPRQYCTLLWYLDLYLVSDPHIVSSRRGTGMWT